MAIEIRSDDDIRVDGHFRVTAGPGAGKTHWLVGHIRHVLKASDRLGVCGKVACISYTNVGVNTIKDRLGTAEERVEVCTIHSFFYQYIVKPYLHFVVDEEGFDISKLQGEDDRYDFSFKTLQAVKQTVGQNYIDDKYLKGAIKDGKWKLKGGKMVCEGSRRHPTAYKSLYFIKNDIYPAYKKIAWKEGLMHYDDVLYFSYRLVEKYPFILDVMVRVFPYFFIDEFQDTNPIQTEIVKQYAAKGGMVGVIGDPAQSIYKFLGADVKQFRSFALEGLDDYEIKDNRRSSEQIVALLNQLRKGFSQTALSGISDDKPRIIVGADDLKCYQKAVEIAKGDVHALSYSNVQTNMLKNQVGKKPTSKYLLDNIEDSNADRAEFIVAFIKAIEHARQGKFKIALEYLQKSGIEEVDAIDDLKYLLANYHKFETDTLAGFYAILTGDLDWDMPPLKAGKAKTFYDAHTYQELALCVGIVEDDGVQRTIHKAKGDEFDHVMVMVGDDNDLSFLLKPNIDRVEAHRVYYVAMSRAVRKLFVSVANLSKKDAATLKNMGFDDPIYV